MSPQTGPRSFARPGTDPPGTSLVLIGAGLHNLTLALHLAVYAPKLLERTTVLDPSGLWLKAWKQRLAAQQIPWLRSSSVMHPHPDAPALRRFAQARGWGDFHDPYARPGTDLFNAFCDDLIERYDLARLVRPARVSSLSVLAAAGRQGLGVPPRLSLSLADGSSPLEADRVVAAPGPGPNLSLPGLASAPSHTWRFWDEIDLGATLPEAVILVGGGLSAAHLALGALKGGVPVTWVLRGPLKRKLFDAEPEWMGPRRLRGFFAESDFQRRRALISQARDGGSVTPELWAALEPYARSGRLELMPEHPVSRAAYADGLWQLETPQGVVTRPGTLWLCLGTDPDLHSWAPAGPLWSEFPLERFEGLPGLEPDLSWPGLPLHFLGAWAALRLGPTTRNLSGARFGARTLLRAWGIPVPEPIRD